LGNINYEDAYAIQKSSVESVLNGDHPQLLLCTHPCVLTMGRLAQEKHVLVSSEELARRNVAVHAIDRGGEVTLHAPGQLVIYPILNLTYFEKDLRRYFYQLEQVAIDLLGRFDIVASRFPGKTGVWVGPRKIVSMGVGVRKWVAYHGLAINVNTDLNLFSMIRPCGLDVEMTSMSEVKGEVIDLKEVEDEIIDCFSNHFQLDCIRS